MDEPRSRWRAKRIGGDHWRQHLGWSPDTYLHATLVDAVQVNSAVTAVQGSGKRPKKITPLARPVYAPQPTAVLGDAEDQDTQALMDAEAFVNDD